MLKSHRELYPEQYTHPSIGLMATLFIDHFSSAENIRRGRIVRVIPSRFGPLAELEGIRTKDGAFVAFLLSDLTIEGREETACP